jgi:ankyrin repeat protein
MMITNYWGAVFSFQALTAAYSILKDPEKRAEYDLSLGGGAGAAVSSKGSVQASSSRGECLTEPEEDGAQNEAGSSAVGKDPDSQVVAVGNEETAAVVEIKAEIEDEASGVDRAVQELLHNKGVATSNSTSDEIQPATDVSDHASTSSPAEVESATGKLWRRAIEKKNPGKLLRLFEEDASNFWKHEREGRTALHIAAMDVTRENVKLTKSILDELLKVRRRNYTEELGEVFRNFSVNVRDYIGAVERESGKTAMTLAEEYFWWEANSKAICEHITVTLKLSEKLVDMDRAVARLKEHSSFPAEVENQTGELWRDAIEKKDLAVLQLLFEEDASNFWKHEREGRTALHVAAMDDTQKNVILAKSILDELLKVRRRNYTDELKDEFRNFSVNVRDYIGAVERESGKTAMTLAEENSKRPKTGRDICEHITATLKLNEEHFGIDRAVARLKQRSGSRAEVENQTGELWRDAIEKKDPAVLLLLFKEDASNFWEHEMAGCTALHVAAMGVNGVNLELAKLILHKLLKVRRRNYTEELGEEFRNFPVNVQDYIGAVERDSGKTAMELAKINYGNFENRKPICKHITITLNLSEEYVDVDRAVERLKERSSFPAEVDNQIGELWRNAIEEKDPAVLLLLFKADASNFWKHELWEGRTALHVAAMGVTRENLELAKSILDELLKVRRRNYTEKLGKVFRNFSVNVRGYIGAVERESGKTAMELAKEKSDKFATGKAICEHIIVTLNLNEEHFGIDRAVETQNEVERGTKLKRDKFPSPTFHGQLSSLIWSQNCEFLLRCFKKKSSWDIWKYKDESGRTVLHVAAMQGCFPLARELLDLARDGNDHGYIEAVDSQSNLTALQMADDIIGNRSIAEYIKFTLERMKNKEYEHPGFFEAYPRTSWRRALARGDCRTLKNMVSSNPRLLLETCKGLTVLHVAIICQALDLVKAVLNWFERTVTYGSSYYPQTPTWKQMFKKEAHFDGNVFADPFPRSSVPGIRADEQKFISAFESLLRDRGPFKGSAEELVTFMQLHELMESDSEMVQVLKNYDGTGVEGSEQNAKGVDDSAKRKLTFSYEQFMVELL